MVQMNKRHLLLGGAAFVATTALFGGLQKYLRYGSAPVLGTAADAQGQPLLVGIDHSGGTRFSIRVQHPAHAAIVLTDRLAVYFTQHPGRVMYVVDLLHGELMRTVELPPDLAFCGRGTLSREGTRFFTSETRASTGEGLIGVYQAGGSFERLGEFASNGICPVQVLALEQSPLLAVANSGVQGQPRRDSSADAAPQTNLSYLDSRNGDLVEQLKPPHQGLSVRHLATTAGKGLLIGVQGLEVEAAGRPLLFSHVRGGGMAAIAGPESVWRSMNQHIGGLATSKDGEFAVSTAPNGGFISLWHTPSGSAIGHFAIADAVDVIWREHEQMFLISTMRGEAVLLRPDPTPRLELFALAPAALQESHRFCA